MMMKARYLAAFLILLGLFVFLQQPKEAKAWGKYGHLVVCDLAYRNLTESSRVKLKQLFNGKKGITVTGVDGKKRHYTSFNLGCLEEDERPRRNPDDHFINVSRDTKSIDGDNCPHNKTCIFAGIRRDLKTLKDETKPQEERVLALMAIGHWIGDIHQPLHVSFADDLGGNWINVKLQGKCGTTKFGAKHLHAVWDSCLLDAGLFERVRKQKEFKTTWGPNTITYRAVSTLQARTGLAEEKSFVGSEPWEWAAESYKTTLNPDVHYCTMVGGTCQYSETVLKLLNEKSKRRTQNIDQDYLKKFERLAEERVKKAGFRLAHLLNQALDPNYTVPIQNSDQGP